MTAIDPLPSSADDPAEDGMNRDGTADDGTAAFVAVRRRLFGIAYRMLGTVVEAEDVVQDAWLRWQGTDRSTVREPSAFLATVTTRLALNALESARLARVDYVGPWLPEPLPVTADDPLVGAERSEAISVAVLLLLERLGPAERASYVLREAFGYSHREIAEVLETTEANARQLAVRARAHLGRDRAASVPPSEQSRLFSAFMAAAREGDLATLESLLAADVISLSDGGGVVSAARKPVVGRVRVAQFLLGVLEKFGQGIDPHPALLNGAPGVIGIRDGTVMSSWVADIGPDGIRGIYLTLNPAKLSRLRGVAGQSW